MSSSLAAGRLSSCLLDPASTPLPPCPPGAPRTSLSQLLSRDMDDGWRIGDRCEEGWCDESLPWCVAEWWDESLSPNASEAFETMWWLPALAPGAWAPLRLPFLAIDRADLEFVSEGIGFPGDTLAASPPGEVADLPSPAAPALGRPSCNLPSPCAEASALEDGEWAPIVPAVSPPSAPHSIQEWRPSILVSVFRRERRQQRSNRPAGASASLGSRRCTGYSPFYLRTDITVIRIGNKAVCLE